MFVILLLVLFGTRNLFCLTLPDCGYATPNKYLGYFKTSNGDVKIQPYNIMSTRSPDICKYICRNDDKCYAASYYQNIYCSLYNTTDFRVDSTKQQSVYKWEQCDWDQSFQSSDGRCLGLFIQYPKTNLTVLNKYLVLRKIDFISVPQCQTFCLSNPICEAIAIDYANLKCLLHQLWPHDYVNITSQNNTDLYRWTCLPNFIENLNLYETPSQPNKLKCTGYWKVVDRNVTLPDIHSPGVYFHTQSYNACLSECNANPICHVALFNISASMCVLPFIEKADSYYYLDTLTFIHFEWFCLKNDSQTHRMTVEEEKYVRLGFECVKLFNNTDTYIAQDNCGHLPAEENFVNCRAKSHPRKWTVTDSCLVGQSFWTIPTYNPVLKIGGKLRNNVTKIFTGLTSFWLAFSEFTVILKVSFLECRRFNGAKGLETFPNSDIIKRSQWYPFPPLHEFVGYERVPINIVLTASQQPFYGCRTKDGCTNILRKLQMLYFTGAGKTDEFDDIPYNFMLDESGHVYEIRGWKNKCEAVMDYNANSLCFAFIGFFQNIHPPVAFLNSVKKMINSAVELGYVEKNYTLYIHQDVTRTAISWKYAVVVKDWYRYRGFIPNNCLNIDWYTCVINGVLIVLMITMTMGTFRCFYHYKSCKRCDFLHMAHFRQIYPDNEYLNIDFDPGNIGDFSRNTVRCIISEKGGFLWPTADDCYRKLLKLWYANKFLRSSSSLHVDNDLGLYLGHLTTYKDKMVVYLSCTENYSGGSEDNWHIVFFCAHPSTYRRLETLLSNELCVCQYFSFNILTFTHLALETVG